MTQWPDALPAATVVAVRKSHRYQLSWIVQLRDLIPRRGELHRRHTEVPVDRVSANMSVGRADDARLRGGSSGTYPRAHAPRARERTAPGVGQQCSTTSPATPPAAPPNRQDLARDSGLRSTAPRRSPTYGRAARRQRPAPPDRTEDRPLRPCDRPATVRRCSPRSGTDGGPITASVSASALLQHPGVENDQVEEPDAP
jgi:hypothetical protein